LTPAGRKAYVEQFGALPSSQDSLLEGPDLGFNVRITYGDTQTESWTLKADAMGRMIPQNTPESQKGFDAAIVGTVEMLSGVEITGVTKVIDDSGRPIMEQYSFLARDYMDVTLDPTD
jgi:hypothetical protein